MSATCAAAAGAAPKRRGRPPGSKNKDKENAKPAKPKKSPLADVFKKTPAAGSRKRAKKTTSAGGPPAKRKKSKAPVEEDEDLDEEQMMEEDLTEASDDEFVDLAVDEAPEEDDALEDSVAGEEDEFSDDEDIAPIAQAEPEEDDQFIVSNPDCYLTEREKLKLLLTPEQQAVEEEIWAVYKGHPDLYRVRLRRLLTGAGAFVFPVATSSSGGLMSSVKAAVDGLSKFTADDTGRAFLWCKRCRSGEGVRFVLSQTRSADEGMTCICTCTKCGERWFMS